MIPKHSNPKSERRQARAPYNFVPLPEKVVTVAEPPRQDMYSGVTGWIDCELETRSLTYVRGMLTEEQFKKHGRKGPDKLSDGERAERAPFFTMTENRPVVPGSSLRGMIRSLVEIVGYGKMRWVATEPKVTFRAVAAARDDPLAEPYRKALGKFARNVRAGYLIRRDGGWYVRPAQLPSDLGWPERNAYLKVKAKFIPTGAVPGLLPFNDETYKPGFHRVSFDVRIGRGRRGPYLAVTDIGTPESGYPYHGTLVWSGNMLETGGGYSPRRNHALILEAKDGAQEVKINPQAVEDYLDGLTEFQKDLGEQGCLQDGRPVFYVEEDGEVIAFGYSPNFRIPAWLAGTGRAATPRDFVPAHLQDDSLLDLADAMFGWTPEPGGKRTTSRAGRVFISDARFVSAKDGVWLSATPITPHVLASPKPTTFQHYLVQDRQQGHDPDDKSSLAHYGTSPGETAIRGHKLYWHKGKVRQSDVAATPKEQEHPKQLARIMPVKSGVRFKFRVYFESLQPEELGALLWVLQVPGEPGKTYRHKIGMGKPLGMGAVAIDKVEVHLTNRRKRYSRLFETHTDRWAEGEEAVTGDFVGTFEQFVLQQIAPGKKRLTELDRIRALLTMLEWPGDQPDKTWTTEWTRYLEIEHPRNDNEYKDRPVLPTPQEVMRVWRGQQTSAGGPIPPQATSPPEYQHGTVKQYLTERAYGFIQPDEGEEDVFVHRSKLARGLTTLRPGQRVRFKVRRGPKGLAAEDVSLEESP